jgi:thiaminase/transcriptional activator TenA
MTMTDSRPTTRFRAAADPVWQRQLQHPLVRGIADGSLDPDRFAMWLAQDYRYLIDYARVFAMGVARAPDLATMSQFATLLHDTLHVEMRLHRELCAEFGIAPEALEEGEMHQTTRGYVDFLIRTATIGSYAELLGALLPCMWGYSWIGQELAKLPPSPDRRYRAWIVSYADPDFARLAEWCRALTDDACEGLPERALIRVEQAFLTSSRYELAFWEMACSEG